MRQSHYTLFISLFLYFYTYAFQINPEHNGDQAQTENIKYFILNEKNTDSIKSFLTKTLTTNPRLAKKYYQFYLTRGIADNDYQIQFIAYYYLGDISYDLGDYESSIHYGKATLTIAKKQKNDRNQIVASNQLGNIYYNIRDYDAALNQYLSAYEIVKNKNFKSLELHILGNISMIRTRIHRYNDALLSYQKIIALLQKDEYKNVPNYPGIYLSSIQGAGVCNFLLKQYDSALEYYKEGFRLAQKYNSNRHIIMFHMTSGEAYIEKGKYDLALEHLYTAKKEINSAENTFNPFLHTTNFHLASVYFKKKEYAKTLGYLSESFSKIKSSKIEDEVEKIAEMYDLAFRSAEKLGDKEKQIQFAKLYRNVIDSLHQDDLSTKDMLYDKDIADLESKNKNLTSQKSSYIIMVIILAFMIIVLSIFYLRKQRKNKFIFEELQNQIKNNKTPSPLSSKKDFITDSKMKKIFDKLDLLEQANFYVDQECTLYTTAKLVETNTTYLSRIINEHKNKSFNEYINELRINHCLEKLKNNKKFRSYTIKAISEELGYKSVNTFGSAFKKQTGLTHSYYLKQMQKENLMMVVEQV